jgi:hypothetical protein
MTWDMRQFGLALVHDRRQRALPTGWNAMTVSDKAGVAHIGLAPVMTQFIDLRLFITYPQTHIQIEQPVGYGIAPPEYQTGAPVFNHYGISFDGPLIDHRDFLVMGRPTAVANTIRVEPGYWDRLIGEPAVSGPIRVTADIPGDYAVPGKPAIWPRTVYAVMEAPQQAIDNDPPLPRSPNYVDDGGWIGAPVVSSNGARIWPRTFSSSWTGRTNRRKTSLPRWTVRPRGSLPILTRQ